ncbi:group III truncated hemoglobin [Methylocapsa polymorpha]|uniref:Group III truncated hemoglobin n=1 Tax=Methylocapsa polymorpha TaxID=3080828 RepID=A0ABZ0HMH4_9HYPH|nr:group III truncated hemoglobin [Methylocapsa sp. RX1]
MEGIATESKHAVQEEAIAACVREFYRKAREDSLLGPIFNAKVDDWDVHLRVVANFWSRALLGTDRYSGSPFVVHMNLPVELEHFSRWLALFEETARETLPPELAGKALAKANHMAESFKAGIFPFVGSDGKPARHPG